MLLVAYSCISSAVTKSCTAIWHSNAIASSQSRSLKEKTKDDFLGVAGKSCNPIKIYINFTEESAKLNTDCTLTDK